MVDEAEVLKARLGFFIPLISITILILVGYYFKGFKKTEKDSNARRRPIIKFLLTIGIYFVPIIIIAIVFYILDEFNYKNGEYTGTGSLLATIFSIISILVFILRYDKKGRSKVAYIFLSIISFFTAIILFYIILFSSPWDY